ncbi:MAG: lytic transglycosylase domain-containing protein [Treponema sp.]|nr:lytic transglycosylase domain-containing protein [Candidatus Treponema equifaecale]
MKTYSLLLIFFLFAFAVFNIPAQVSDSDFLELIDPDEIEEFYINEEETHLILKLFDEENIFRTIVKAGGIEVPDTDYAQGMIRKYTAQYLTSGGSKFLCASLSEGENYRLYVRSELKKRNMPAALEYLPMVESEYKINARSRSGALGMWQFMENSIAPFMKKNEWVDERLDPWLSTKAALSKLQDNYRVFKDWPLAIAAYNCGAGAMRRILESAEEKSFWYIAENGLLRDESVNYIPKLLAITAIAEHPERYDLIFPDADERIRYDSFDYVEVADSVHLDWLAMELRLDFDTLKKLNNSLIRNQTPPKETYRIRLPEGLGQTAEEILYFDCKFAEIER